MWRPDRLSWLCHAGMSTRDKLYAHVILKNYIIVSAKSRCIIIHCVSLGRSASCILSCAMDLISGIIIMIPAVYRFLEFFTISNSPALLSSIMILESEISLVGIVLISIKLRLYMNTCINSSNGITETGLIITGVACRNVHPK